MAPRPNSRMIANSPRRVPIRSIYFFAPAPLVPDLDDPVRAGRGDTRTVETESVGRARVAGVPLGVGQWDGAGVSRPPSYLGEVGGPALILLGPPPLPVPRPLDPRCYDHAGGAKRDLGVMPTWPGTQSPLV
jgi:hypothetical protein